MKASPLFFSGSSHPDLATEIVKLSGMEEGLRNIHLFPDGEIFVEILEPVQDRNIYVFQSLGEKPNFHLMELFILLDALKRADASTITVILPYYTYARQDRLDKSGSPITAKLVADLLVKAGATHLITIDLHSEQIEGFFDIPVRQLLSRDILIPYCQSLNLLDMVVVAPDNGGIKIAAAYAKALNVPIALIDKERINSFQVEMRLFVGDVKDKSVILTDDMCSTGGTLVHAAHICADLGARSIIAVVAHGLFIEDALDKIEKSPIEMVISTNSIPKHEKAAKSHKIRDISIASLIANAIDNH